MEVCSLAEGSHDKAPQHKVTETCCLTALEPRSLQHQAPSRALWEDSPVLPQPRLSP